MSYTPQPDLEVRVPARLCSAYNLGALKIWLFARALDPEGSGIVTFCIGEAALALNRSITTIKRYLRQARRDKLLRFTEHWDGFIRVGYSALGRVAAAAGLEALGPVADFVPVTDLENLSILATEIERDALQLQSFYNAREEEKQRLKAEGKGSLKPEMVPPEKIWFSIPDRKSKNPPSEAPPCDNPARVLGANKRWIFVSEGFVTYGASCGGIAVRRNLSDRTIQRHLSNTYRSIPSPIREFRADLMPCRKRQLAQRMPRKFKSVMQVMQSCNDAEIQKELRRYKEIGGRIWKAHTNLYHPDHYLVSCRFRKAKYKESLSAETGASGGLDNNLSLYVPGSDSLNEGVYKDLENQEKG